MGRLVGQVPEARRYYALDGYRFIAASLVAVYHYNTDFRLGLEQLSPAVPQLGVMVDFFFLLSGFVIAVSYMGRMNDASDYARFLRARFARLYPLHLLTLAATLALMGAGLAFGVRPNHPEAFALSALPANFASLHAWGLVDHLSFNGGSWSISAEWFVYLLAPLAFLAARRLPLAANVLLLAAIVCALTFVRSALGLRPWWDSSYDFGAARAVPTFFAGVLIAVCLHAIPDRFAPRWTAAHATFALALLLLHFGAPRETVIATFALLLTMAALAERAGRPTVLAGRAMTTAGDASYAFYLTHGLVAIVPLFVLRRFGLVGGPAACVVAIAAGGATLFVSVWLYRRFEQPTKRWILGAARRAPMLRDATAR